jgi:hypothetical protein
MQYANIQAYPTSPQQVKKICAQSFTEKFFDNGWPVIIDKRRKNAYGIIVPQKVLFPKEFRLCIESLRSLISTSSTSNPPQIIAVAMEETASVVW